MMIGVRVAAAAYRRRRSGSEPAPEVPSEEQLTIDPGHGSGVYDITAINGITIDNFAFIEVVAEDLTWTTTGTLSYMGLGLSPDAGSTIRGGISSISNATETEVQTARSPGLLVKVPVQTSFKGLIFITSANVVAPTSVTFTDLTSANAAPATVGWTTDEAEVHNLLRLQLVMAAGSDDWTGGTIRLKGWR